jgi:LCP family protein required for cell wall assembly
MNTKKPQSASAFKRTGTASAFSRKNMVNQQESRGGYVPAHGAGVATMSYTDEYSADLHYDDPRRKLKNRVIIGVGIALALLLVGIGVWAASFMFKVTDNMKLDDEVMHALDDALVKPATPEEPFYVLLIGSDSRESGNAEAGRSDTMMLVRTDPKNAQVTILSVPRDIEIIYGDYGNVRINAAFAYDGPAGAVRAVNELCGVQISHYAEIDFEGVIGLVDVLGGIDVNVPVEIELAGVVVPAGEQHINGEQALAMSRNRNYVDGDLTRVKHQQLLVKAVAKKVLSAPLTQIPSLVETLSDCIATDMDTMAALDLVNKLRGMNTDAMNTATVPTWFNNHDGVSYLGVTEPDFSQMMERIRAGKTPVPSEEELAQMAASQEAQNAQDA